MSANPKITFPNHLGAKRRRMRSGGNVSTLTNNTPKTSNDMGDEKTVETSRCKGATTIPIFLKSELHQCSGFRGDNSVRMVQQKRRKRVDGVKVQQILRLEQPVF